MEDEHQHPPLPAVGGEGVAFTPVSVAPPPPPVAYGEATVSLTSITSLRWSYGWSVSTSSTWSTRFQNLHLNLMDHQHFRCWTNLIRHLYHHQQILLLKNLNCYQMLMGYYKGIPVPPPPTYYNWSRLERKLVKNHNRAC